MRLQSENNITAIRRLGWILKANVDETGQESRARCRPLLVTTSNSHFLNSCSAHSHYLLNYPMPVCVKKIHSQSDRRLEKDLLAKRYEMVTTEGKDRKDFRKKNFEALLQNWTGWNLHSMTMPTQVFTGHLSIYWFLWKTLRVDETL